MRTTPLVMRHEGAEFSLRRISDNELHRLGKRAEPIEPDALFWMRWNARRPEPRTLPLPQFFVGMAYAFGGSGCYFDDYKSSFCFPFHLTTVERGVRGDYLLLVRDWKGGIEAGLFRRGAASRSEHGGFHPFVDAEFSRDDFRYVMSFLGGFVEGFLESTTAGPLAAPIPDFVNCVGAAALLYGYRDGKPFERSFADGDDYYTALAEVPAELRDVDIGDTL